MNIAPQHLDVDFHRTEFTTTMKTPLILTLALAGAAAFAWQADAHDKGRQNPLGNSAPVCCFGPTCQATGKIVTLTCTGDETTYQLDASGSFDPDGDPVTFFWISSAGSTIDDQFSPITTLRVDTSQNCGQLISIRLIVSDGTLAGLCRLFVETVEDNSICPAKPSKIEMVYTGEDCGASSHVQDPAGVTCNGDPAFADPVHIRVSMKSQPSRVYFDGIVPLNGTFEMDGAGQPSGKVPPNSKVEIFDMAGTLLQVTTFHTSCSQPLNVGDQFGATRLTGYTP